MMTTTPPRLPSLLPTLVLLAAACLAGGAASAQVVTTTTTIPGTNTATTTSSGTQQVQDKDVFEQNKVMMVNQAANTKAVSDLNTTVKNAVTRRATVGGAASTKDMRIEIPDDADTNATIDATYAKVRQMGCAKPDKKTGAVMPAKQLEVCQKIEKMAYDMVTMLRANLAKSKKRATTIDSLLTILDSTGADNLKETADLSARIQVETALMQNEKVMMDMAIAKNDQQMRLYNQLLVALEDDSEGDEANNNFKIGK